MSITEKLSLLVNSNWSGNKYSMTILWEKAKVNDKLKIKENALFWREKNNIDSVEMKKRNNALVLKCIETLCPNRSINKKVNEIKTKLPKASIKITLSIVHFAFLTIIYHFLNTLVQ